MATVDPKKLKEFLEPYEYFWKKYRDPIEWVRDGCMRTKHNLSGTFKTERVPMPLYDYMIPFIRAFYGERKLQVDKSRQLSFTWMVCGLAVHEAQYNPSWITGYQNITLLHACQKMDGYILYVLKAQPLDRFLPWLAMTGPDSEPPKEWVETISSALGLSMVGRPQKATQPPYWGSPAYEIALKYANRYDTSSGSEGLQEIRIRPFFTCEYGTWLGESVIEAIPSGAGAADKWRGSTRNRAIHDEAWFVENLRDTINSAAQTLGGIGFQTLITTPSQGKDKWDVERGMTAPLRMIDLKSRDAMNGTRELEEKYGRYHGIEWWRTEMGYSHMRVWYYAHPDRRSKEWYKRNIEEGDMRINRREQLLEYDVPEGEAYYATFKHSVHVVPQGREVPFGTGTLVGGQDGGRTPATLIAEVNEMGRIVVQFEIQSSGMDVNRHAERVEPILSKHYPHWKSEFTLYCDPSMQNKSESSSVSAWQQLLERGWRVHPASSQRDDDRYQAVSRFLNEYVDLGDEFGHAPRLMIHPRCGQLIKALNGQCQVDTVQAQGGVNKKVKNEFSHLVDALEYLCLMVNPDRLGRHGKKRRFRPFRQEKTV